MTTISLVMIVKNEERILERCVESVRPIIDEFIIVDTGSTDGTRETINRYGALYELPFTNFVDTKNAALALATGEYVLFMDADELVISGLEFLKEHAETGTECVLAQIVEGAGSNVYFRARLWRNTSGIVSSGRGSTRCWRVTAVRSPTTVFRSSTTTLIEPMRATSRGSTSTWLSLAII